MKFRNIFLFLMIPGILSVPLIAFGAEQKPLVNIGFIPNNIWYSEYPFFAGENVRIYTIVFNSGKGDLLGTISFSDGANIIGTKDFSVSGGGKTQDVWIDWIPERGEHIISAVITSARISKAGQPDEPVELAYRESGAQKSFADSDNDGDRIGDTVDTDDDNDGILDTDEIAQKTDPLRTDTDGDGVPDKEDDLPLLAEEKKENPFFAGDKLAEVALFAEKYIPENIQGVASRALARTEEFRIEQKGSLTARKAEAQKRVDALAIPTTPAKKETGGTTGDAGDEIINTEKKEDGSILSYARTPWTYAQLFFWTFLLFLVSYKTVFYLVALFLAWKIGRWLIRSLRERF